VVSVLDVAEHARVSSATVSRALSGSRSVTAETRERVMASVRALGYQPNSFARNLRTGRGHSVALVTGDIQHGIYPALAKHTQHRLESLGFDLLLFNLGHQEERLRHLLQKAVPLGLRGILLASADQADMDNLLPYFRKAMDKGVTIIAVSQRLDDFGIPSIVHDDRKGAMKAVHHLHQHGHRRIAFLGRIRTSAVGNERYQGYVRALKELGQAVDPDLVWDVSDGYRSEAGYKLTQAMLQRGTKAQGILTASDELAVGALAAIKDFGCRAPDDIGIVGFGGIEWGRFVRPSLSTIALDVKAMADSVRRWFAELDQSKRELLTLIEPQLIVRGSS
jgi:DNA-binding LacI/PurR family transcriptional regulator